MKFEAISIVHFSGDYSPHDWLFDDNGFKTWTEYIDNHLMKKYGQVKDRGNIRNLQQSLSKWKDIWQQVLANIEVYEELSTEDKPVVCRPWILHAEGDDSCPDCMRWPLPARTAPRAHLSENVSQDNGKQKRRRASPDRQRQCKTKHHRACHPQTVQPWIRIRQQHDADNRPGLPSGSNTMQTRGSNAMPVIGLASPREPAVIGLASPRPAVISLISPREAAAGWMARDWPAGAPPPRKCATMHVIGAPCACWSAHRGS